MNTPTESTQYRHVVLLQFKAEAAPQKVLQCELEFVALADKISVIESLEWGRNVNPEGLNEELSHCFFITFKSKQDFETYLPHPAHRAFVEQLQPILEKVVVLDYLTNKTK